MSLPDDSSIAHDPEHGIGSERHSGVISSGLGGRVEAGSGRSIGVRDGYGTSVVTSTSEGIDVVLQELRSISARLTNVDLPLTGSGVCLQLYGVLCTVRFVWLNIYELCKVISVFVSSRLECNHNGV